MEEGKPFCITPREFINYMQAGKKLWVKCDATKDHMTTGCGATNR